MSQFVYSICNRKIGPTHLSLACVQVNTSTKCPTENFANVLVHIILMDDFLCIFAFHRPLKQCHSWP